MPGFYKTFRDVAQQLSSKARAGSLSEVQAYQWLMDRASFINRQVKLGKFKTRIERGSVVTTMAFLAKAWHWRQTKVKRFLIKLGNIGCVDKISYNNSVKLLMIKLDVFGRRFDPFKEPLQVIGITTTNSNSSNGVSIPSEEVTLRGDIPNSSEVLSQLPSIRTGFEKLYKKERILIHNTITLQQVSIEPINFTNELATKGAKMSNEPGSNKQVKLSLVPSSSSTAVKPEASGIHPRLRSPPIQGLPKMKLIRRRGTPLPYPRGTDSPVLLTDYELISLTEAIGGLCVNFQVQALVDYSEDNPRAFAKYQNHAKVIKRWHQMKTEKGLKFCAFHSDRPGYYPQWIYESEMEKQKKIRRGED